MKILTFALLYVLIATNTCFAQNAQPESVAKAKQPITADSYRNVARTVSPSVVNIRIKKNTLKRVAVQQYGKRPNLIVPYGLNDELRKQLENLLDEQYSQMAPGSVAQEEYVGAGSGVIIRQDGYIITSYHVITQCGPDNIEVTLSDGTKFGRADIIGTDELTDLAILKVTSERQLPAATWGDSDQLEPGDIVVAIGNPLDFNNTISEGIVSAKHRIIKKAPIEDLIQTTAMINPGNSGGALADLNGKVIGINMAIATDTGLWSGLGFAIPSRLAQSISDQLISSGKVSRGYLGIEMEPLTGALAKQLNYDKQSGIVVRDVNKNSGAIKAGIQRYDIIVKVDGKDVNDSRDMVSRIASRNVGDVVTLEVFRNEGNTPVTRQFSVTLGERPDLAGTSMKPTLPGATPGQTPDANRNLYGLSIKTGGAKGGVEVTAVEPQSPGAIADIKVGDVILEINKKKVTNTESMVDAFSTGQDNDSHLVYIERNGQSIFAQIPSK